MEKFSIKIEKNEIKNKAKNSKTYGFSKKVKNDKKGAKNENNCIKKKSGIWGNCVSFRNLDIYTNNFGSN